MAGRQITNIEVKRNNRNRIFRYICKCDKISNPDLSYELKMSLPTVMQNTKELTERGLVQEAGELQSTGGRRAKALSVVADFKLAVGLDITKNHVSLILINLTGQILKYERSIYPFRQESGYYCGLNEKMEIFLDEAGVEREKLLGIGISFPGIIDFKNEWISYSHILRIKSLPFASISSYFAYPCYFFNDANAGAYAEGITSNTTEQFFYLSLSNTVGGAVFANHELIQGKNFRCSEVGHMTIVPDGECCYCGKMGCLDAYCAARRLSDVTGGQLEKFFCRLEENEPEAVKEWERYLKYLVVAVNNIHMLLDCDVVLGGYVGSYIERYIPDIRTRVAQRNTFGEDGSFVKACQHKIGAAALGAARSVIETFIEQV